MPASRQDDSSSYSHQVFARLREQIIGGALRPGERLVERELAQQLGVSRVPVREALQRLDQAGLVTRAHNRAARVGVPSEQDVLDTLEVRASLEPLAARLAAERVDDPGRRALRAALSGARAAHRAGDSQAFASANASFHEALVKAAGNRVLEDMIVQIRDRIRWLFGMTSEVEPSRMQAEHRAIYQAIATGESETAAARAYEHVLESRDPTIELLRQVRGGG